MLLSCFGIFVINPIQSLLWLVLVFILAGFLLLELGAEFLAILLILVYVGAIAVLFLFVIMLLNIRKIELHNYYINYLPILLFISLFFFLEIFFIIFLKNNINTSELTLLNIDFFWINNLYYTSNIEVIGILLFDVYYYYFFFLSLILLVALVGALILLVNTKNNNYKKKKINKWNY